MLEVVVVVFFFFVVASRSNVCFLHHRGECEKVKCEVFKAVDNVCLRIQTHRK